MARNYEKRLPKEYNLWRYMWQIIVCRMVYAGYYKVFNDYKIIGRENIPKDRFFIAASNHVSAIDPFLVADALLGVGKPVAYMAKKELFEKPIARFWLDLLGAFAVNREKLGVSTIKTALGLKNTNWALGLFPQGTREADDNLDNVARGFAGLAKTMKCDILPIGISGVKKESRQKYKNKITIKIGKPIPYNNDTAQMVKDWSASIQELTGER